MRAILGCAAALALSAGLAADDKKPGAIDAKMLIGRWEPKEKKEDVRMVIEFAKGGKMTVTITDNGKDTKLDGTYTLAGNEITTTVTVGDRERKRTRTISRLTDTELVSTDETGKEDTLLRVKDK